MNLSDALLNIRNQWGLWVDKVNSQYGLTKKLSAFLVNFFSKLLGWLDKAVAFIDKIADKVGGMENLLKLLAMAAGSIWLALNAGKILSFFKSLSGLLTTANLKTLALVAVIMLVALAIDDLIHFMKGDESVIGDFFEEMGIDADAVRETIGGVISFLGSLISTIADLLGKGLKTGGIFCMVHREGVASGRKGWKNHSQCYGLVWKFKGKGKGFDRYNRKLPSRKTDWRSWKCNRKRLGLCIMSVFQRPGTCHCSKFNWGQQPNQQCDYPKQCDQHLQRL